MSFDKQRELCWLNSNITPLILEQLQHQHPNQNVEVCKADIKLIGTEEAFMLTICYRAIMHFTIDGKEVEKLFVVKRVPKMDPKLYNMVGFSQLFQNEVHAYTEIIPAMFEFTKEPFESLNYVYGETTEFAPLVVLEDFKTHGWQLCQQKYNLSLEHILLAVGYIAKFHGIGYAMKAANAGSFLKMVNRLQEARHFSEMHPDFLVQIQCGIERIKLATLKLYPEIEEFVMNFVALFGDSHQYCLAKVKPAEPFATVCHSDYLRNNLAFKYDESNKPINVMMFDMQTARYCNPMIDICTLLMLSTFAETREKNFEKILSHYCTTLQETYEKYAKSKAPAFMSYDSMLKEYIKFCPYSMFIAGFFLLNMVEPLEVSSEEFVKMDREREEIWRDLLTRGGEVIDKELAHQVYELYKLSKAHNVDITQN